jgi:Leucine-rich repeat (LRR) protein
MRLHCHAVGGEPLAHLLGELARCPRLQSLGLGSCGLRELPAALLRLVDLYDLDLNDNDVAAIPRAIATMRRLVSLVVSNNPIASVAPELAELTTLEHLRIGGSSRAPGTLARLPSLGALTRLSKLSLGALPALESAQLEQCAALTALELVGPVTPRGVPEELGSQTRLRALAFTHCALAELPGEVRSLVGLECLSLAYGSFARLPEWLGELPALRYLSVIGCGSLDADQLVGLVARMPGLARVFVYYPFPPSARKTLVRAGFVTQRSNPSVLEREGSVGPPDPFGWIR